MRGRRSWGVPGAERRENPDGADNNRGNSTDRTAGKAFPFPLLLWKYLRKSALFPRLLSASSRSSAILPRQSSNARTGAIHNGPELGIAILPQHRQPPIRRNRRVALAM